MTNTLETRTESPSRRKFMKAGILGISALLGASFLAQTFTPRQDPRQAYNFTVEEYAEARRTGDYSKVKAKVQNIYRAPEEARKYLSSLEGTIVQRYPEYIKANKDTTWTFQSKDTLTVDVKNINYDLGLNIDPTNPTEAEKILIGRYVERVKIRRN